MNRNSSPERRKQGVLAAALSIWILLIAIIATIGGDGWRWSGISLAVVAATAGVYLGVRGLRRGRTHR